MKKLITIIVLGASVITAPAFAANAARANAEASTAQHQQVDPNSPAETGGGSIGYNRLLEVH